MPTLSSGKKAFAVIVFLLPFQQQWRIDPLALKRNWELIAPYPSLLSPSHGCGLIYFFLDFSIKIERVKFFVGQHAAAFDSFI
jgi:hypothetical protein